jgi:hypothetical protein
VQSRSALIYHRATSRKGMTALLAYALGMGFSFYSPAIGLSLAGIVAIFWMLPWSPLDALFVGKDDCEEA